ncbi:DUF930 domain-containing protein [Roseibium marinum]|uniref:Uncharacterized protein DUF930 n=1 Tax=Roseibium marinum TaxID=281252 RepID=A0A2S3UY24_9HYPH|nr:DUF930 domain-containing protein [Roseibium marinum]POF32423.1 uncharacterized protein DUF930 [Roseibium marinum]
MGFAERANINHLTADRFAWMCAIWLHLLFFAVLTGQAARDRTVRPAPEPISVEIVVQPPLFPTAEPPASGRLETDNAASVLPEPEQQAALTPGTLSPETAPAEPQEKTPETGWVTATGYYASDVLSDPRSSQARQALTSVTEDDRVEQLCALEAMEQVRHALPDFRPTRLMPHARRNSFRKDDAVFAPAGALRSNRIWYEIAYKCRLDASGSAIIGFEYALGAPIVRALWDELGLAAIH